MHALGKLKMECLLLVDCGLFEFPHLSKVIIGKRIQQQVVVRGSCPEGLKWGNGSVDVARVELNTCQYSFLKCEKGILILARSLKST